MRTILCRFSAVAAAFVSLVAGAGAQCSAPPLPVTNIESNTFYKDAKYSVVDPELWERRRVAMKPIEDFRMEVSRYASRALGGDKAWAACFANWMSHWADGGALLGSTSGMQGEFERVWTLASLSMAYLSVRESLPNEPKAKIEAWLAKVAERCETQYARRTAHPNNHLYWLALALGATAQFTNNQQHAALSRKAFELALGQIGADGALRLEMDRGRLALHYHNFALQPLILLAELAARRGENWYLGKHEALHRLVAFTMSGFLQPQKVEQSAGAPQRVIERKELAWLPFYAARFPEKLPAGMPVAGDDIWSFMTGGNMSQLAKVWIVRH